jgi:hypothetical protein
VTAATVSRPAFDWEERGRVLGDTLDDYAALVVVGQDATATARVALGIGRTQALHRWVAIGDLFGDAPPLKSLISDDDPHGLVDSFTYGISLKRIARPVDETDHLFVMPTGSEEPDHAEILSHRRWRQIATEFREADALLLVIAPAGAPGIADLVDSTDGAIVAGELPSDVSIAPVVALIREPRTAPPQVRREAPAPPRRLKIPPRIAATFGIGASLLIAALVLWLSNRPSASSTRPNQTKGVTDTAALRLIKALPDTTKVDSSGVPSIANPTDSASAAGYAVELSTTNTQAGAILKVRGDTARGGSNLLPAGTFAPVLIRGARWFKVYAGAYTRRSGADTLLALLRRRGVLDTVAGTVVQVPYAFLIESNVPAAAVDGMVATYADRGQPVYALRQADGTAQLYAGAFEFPEQAVLFAESLRAAGLTPVLVYRKGRVF